MARKIALNDCKSVKQVGKWLLQHGITPGENRDFGKVHPVHTSTSMHYQLNARGIFASDKQGNLALDVNDQSVDDDKFAKKFGKVDNETEALTIVYFRILHVAERFEWPLNEMFFSGWGFRKETGYDRNVPIGGHATHLHAAWDFYRWQ